MENTLDLARNAEKLGYERFWISEHHNMDSIVSSATVVLLGYVAQGTDKIRVGSGGIMLPNHAPLIVAEQFGTLATLYPGRIDLGLGRAPGTDQLTAHALRRGRDESVQDFPNNIAELQQYFSADNLDSRVRAIPGEGLDIPLYLLGSSTFSAELAGKLGLPYAFASHFAPAHLYNALELYAHHFKSSQQLERPYAMACVNVIAAETDQEAQRLATSLYQFAMGIITNVRRPLPPPIASMDGVWNEAQEAMIKNMMHYTFIGSKETVEQQLKKFVETTGVREIIVVSHIHGHEDRVRSYEIISDIFTS
tara:strand:+ start:45023 stop:45946 length:924 start_codon:yes stop_codon:yes gene_type:complete